MVMFSRCCCESKRAASIGGKPVWQSPADEARDAFVTADLLKKMTVIEKIGQLRLISVGPDNPKKRFAR